MCKYASKAVSAETTEYFLCKLLSGIKEVHSHGAATAAMTVPKPLSKDSATSIPTVDSTKYQATEQETANWNLLLDPIS